MPVVEGAWWTYDTIDADSGTRERRTQRVGPFEAMASPKEGVIASPLITEKQTGTIINWQEDTGTAVVRHRQLDEAGEVYRDDIYDAFKLRLDEAPERLVEGARYTQSYVTRSVIDGSEVLVERRTEQWDVASDGEWIEVPAGRFCAMQVTRQRTTDEDLGQVKRYWFTRGVGKIMERSERSEEVLTDFDVPE